MLLGRKWTLIAIGSAVLVYSIVVLCFIVTTPDVGLRVLLSEADSPQQALAEGIRIHATPHMIVSVPNRQKETPQVGDRLLRLGDLPTHSFLDFACQMDWLRNAKPKDGPLARGEDLWKAVETLGPSELVEYSGGERWIRAEFLRPEATGQPAEKFPAYLQVQSLPLGEVFLSFIWFSLQLGFFSLSGLLCWNRPFDRAARVLFGLGIVGLGAFIAGSHWWVMAANLWLIVPCATCGILLPAVLLHFFLVFPRPKLFLQKHRALTMLGVYLVPSLAVAATLVVVGLTSRIHDPGDSTKVAGLFPLLDGLRYGIYGYFCVAAVYFLLSLFVFWQSLRHSQQSKERQQLRWIWHGATLASIFLAVTLVLAFKNRGDFALGSGRIPMFLAAVSFMVAFSVAMVRHQLMQVDQIISRNMLYYVASLGLTGIISLMIALSILVPQWFNLTLSTQQALTVAAVLTLSVILLLWLRDLFQQMIDRQFFRDRYRLDKALQRIQHSVAKLGDPKAIAQLFLGSCRDVLGVERGALYLRSACDEPFQLMALAGAGDGSSPLPLDGPFISPLKLRSVEGWLLPSVLPLDAPFLSTLKDQGSLQRITPGSRSELSPEQALLWELDVDLVHALESSEGVAGLVLLGEKRHAISFTSEDLTFLNALGQIANVAMYSAQVVDQNISRLNEELELKLEKISDQQRQIVLLQAQLTQISDEPARAAAAVPGAFRREECKGSSPAMRNVLDTARKVAASETSVLLRGESGTGKEVIAQVLHNNSSRAGKPMIRVHCASLSPSLLESELFGHVRGAFTGAHQDRVGRFEAANGGTLFLDEIGDISLETQIKLLRVLQERCFEPVGSVQTVRVDVRLITATHQNLEELIRAGTFREDLFYRLNVISMELPPLRERREDILELAIYFLGRAAKRLGKTLTHIDEKALDLLERYRWPGNIRELENIIERAVVLAEGLVITPQELPAELTSAKAWKRPDSAPVTPWVIQQSAALRRDDVLLKVKAPPAPVEAERTSTNPTASAKSTAKSAASANGRKPRLRSVEVEREELLAALEECGGNKSQAAKRLGLPRSTFFSKLKRHGIA